ncbi:unnamed protein product [Brassica oleracea]
MVCSFFISKLYVFSNSLWFVVFHFLNIRNQVHYMLLNM